MLALPTLSELSWVTDPSSVLDRTIAYFIVADYSQSLIYRGNVSSLPYIIQKHQDNISVMSTEISNTLRTMLERYFSEVNVETRDVTSDPGDSKVSLSLYVDVKDLAGNYYKLSRLIETKDGAVNKIVTINNG